jgi:hypothetical protein
MKLALNKMQPGPLEQEEMTQTGLKGSIVKRKMEQKFERTMEKSHLIKPRTIGGKDLRPEKTKREDRHMVGFKVTMAE